MKKKSLSILLSVVLILGVLPISAFAADLPFTDIPANAWYKDAVTYAYENGLFKGNTDTEFAPNAPMTRAMFVQVLANKTGNYNKADWAGKSSFKDVKSSTWYAAPIEWASKAGLVSGVGGNKFAPEENVSREQMAVIMYNYAKKTGNDTKIDNGVLNKFSDSSRISSWAKEAMQWAVTYGIVNGSNGKINPQNDAKRCEVAQVAVNADPVLVKTDVEVGEEQDLDFDTAYLNLRKPLNNVKRAMEIYQGASQTDRNNKIISDLISIDSRYGSCSTQNGIEFSLDFITFNALNRSILKEGKTKVDHWAALLTWDDQYSSTDPYLTKFISLSEEYQTYLSGYQTWLTYTGSSKGSMWKDGEAAFNAIADGFNQSKVGTELFYSAVCFLMPEQLVPEKKLSNEDLDLIEEFAYQHRVFYIDDYECYNQGWSIILNAGLATIDNAGEITINDGVSSDDVVDAFDGSKNMFLVWVSHGKEYGASLTFDNESLSVGAQLIKELIRDNVSDQTKKEFLNQLAILPSENLIAFGLKKIKTGTNDQKFKCLYTGETIDENISQTTISLLINRIKTDCVIA